MKEYKVLLDTSVYEAACFSFQSSRFKSLERFADQGLLNLLSCSIICSEVESHICQHAKDAAKHFNACLKKHSRQFAPYRSEEAYSSQFKELKPNDMLNLCIGRFQDFLTAAKVEMMCSNGIDTEAMITDYFVQNPPFEKKKPEEFKDAMIIRTFIKYLTVHEDGRLSTVYCVVAEDQGFRDGMAALVPADSSVHIYSSLNDFLKEFTLFNARMRALTKYLNTDAVYDELADAIRDYLESTSFYTGEPTDEFELQDIDKISFELQWVDIADAQRAEAEFRVNAEVKVWYSYIDEERSFFDKEDWCYLWKAQVETSATHKITFEITLDIDISDFGMHADDPNAGTVDYDFDDDSISVAAVHDGPDSITLDEDNCVDIEVESSDPFDDSDGEREYALDMCPDCGTPIGLANDGGNGFCQNCAPRH